MRRTNVEQRAASHPWSGRRRVKLAAYVYLLHITRQEATTRQRRHEHKDR